MKDYQKNLLDQKRKLLKAIEYLEYSQKRVANLSTDVAELDDQSLEHWESFTARFARVADFFMSRYLKTMVLLQDPGFRGTLRDILNMAEKMQLIDSAEKWLAIRELRNITVHEYADEDLGGYFKRLRLECPQLLAIKKIIMQ